MGYTLHTTTSLEVVIKEGWISHSTSNVMVQRRCFGVICYIWKQTLVQQKGFVWAGVYDNNVTEGENIVYPLGSSEVVLYHIEPQNSHLRPRISLVRLSSNDQP